MSAAGETRPRPGRRRFGRRAATYSALLWPGGIELIEYKADRKSTTVVRHVRRLSPFYAPDHAAQKLAEMVEAEGGRGGELVVVLRGFGSLHRYFALPSAPHEILAPIVRRDMQRFDPEMTDPLVGFVRVRFFEDDVGPKEELLAGSVSAAFAKQLTEACSARQISLRHLTIVPRAVQRLYDGFVGGTDPALIAILLPGAPVVAAFDHGLPILVREPPISADADPNPAASVAAELVERAAFFVRQKVGGVAVQRVMLAASGGDTDRFDAALTPGSGLSSQPLATMGASPGALLALGAALDAVEPDGLNLLPSDAPRRDARARVRRYRMMVAMPLVAALLFAGAGLIAEMRAFNRIELFESEVVARTPLVQQVLPTLESRFNHKRRLELLDQVGSGKEDVRRILEIVGDVTPSGTRLDTLGISPGSNTSSWQVTVAGNSTSTSSAAAVRQVNFLYKGLQQRLPVDDIDLRRLEYLSADSLGHSIAVGFGMSFIVTFGANP